MKLSIFLSGKFGFKYKSPSNYFRVYYMFQTILSRYAKIVRSYEVDIFIDERISLANVNTKYHAEFSPILFMRLMPVPKKDIAYLPLITLRLNDYF